MKKLMRKLVLSSFALALAVVTLTTTTFAWYTNNVDVKADGVVGTSSTSGSSFLMISKNATDWYTSITLLERDLNASYNSMVPVQYNAPTSGTTPTFSLINNSGTVESTTKGWLEFKLYFRLQNDVEQELFIKSMTLTNTTKNANGQSALPSKDVLAGAKTSIDGSYSNSTYQVDILRTLLVSAEIKEKRTTAVGVDPTITATHRLFDPEKLCTMHTDDDLNATYDAHAYYDAVMKLEAEDSITKKMPTGLTYKAGDPNNSKMNYNAEDLSSVVNLTKLCDLPASYNDLTDGDFVEITFCIFINGWDMACFDAVQGQSFSIEMQFDSRAKTSV